MSGAKEEEDVQRESFPRDHRCLTHCERAQSLPGHHNQCSLGAAKSLECGAWHWDRSAPHAPVAFGGFGGVLRSIWGRGVISSPSRRAAPRREQAKWDPLSHPGRALGQQVGNEVPPSLEPAGRARGAEPRPGSPLASWAGFYVSPGRF